MTQLNPFASDINAVAAEMDMTKPTQGGGDYTPPAAGPCRLRFVGYVEIGSHLKKGFQGAPDKVKPQARAFFEVSGPKHPPVERDGKRFPCAIVELRLDISLNEKAGFKKLFDRLNYKGTATHIALLLGEGFRGNLVHREYKGTDGKPRIALELKTAEGWQIFPPRVEDAETGEMREVQVAPALTPLKCLLWSRPTRQQWESINIPGEYPAVLGEDGSVIRPARSKNYLQELCRAAENYEGSALQALLDPAPTPGLALGADALDDLAF